MIGEFAQSADWCSFCIQCNLQSVLCLFACIVFGTHLSIDFCCVFSLRPHVFVSIALHTLSFVCCYVVFKERVGFLLLCMHDLCCFVLLFVCVWDPQIVLNFPDHG